MKKFIMIIIAAGFVTIVSARPNHDKNFEQKNNKYENRKNDKFDQRDASNSKEKQQKLRQNDWYFEQRIREVKMNYRLSDSKKYRQIYQLQQQRNAAAQRIEDSYAFNNNRHYNQSKW